MCGSNFNETDVILWKNENATSKMILNHFGISGLTICRQTFDANTSVSVKSQNSFCRCWLNGQIIVEKIVESTWFVTETPRVIQRWQKRSDSHVQLLPGNLFILYVYFKIWFPLTLSEKFGKWHLNSCRKFDFWGRIVHWKFIHKMYFWLRSSPYPSG